MESNPTAEKSKNTPRDPQGIANALAALSPKTEGFWSKMSEGGKKIAKAAYEGIDKVTGIGVVVGKLGVKYNSRWVEKQEAQGIRFNEKIANLSGKIDASEKVRADMIATIADLKAQGLPGADTLEVKLKVLDLKTKELEATLEKSKKELTPKFEALEKRRTLFATKRDAIADKLIRRYEDKLNPLEKKLEDLQERKDKADLLMAVTEAKHKQQLETLAKIENRKKQREETLRSSGVSEKQITKDEVIKSIMMIIENGQNQIRNIEDTLRTIKTDIDIKFARLDVKAIPYREKKAQFIAAKEGKPIQMEVPKKTENTVAHPTVPDKAITTDTIEQDNGVELEEETKASVLDLVAICNEHLTKVFGAEAQKQLIDLRDFLRTTTLSKDSVLELQDFKKIFEKYCKVKKIPMDKFRKKIVEILDQAIEEKNKQEEEGENK